MGKNYILSTPPVISKKLHEYGIKSYICPMQVPYPKMGGTLLAITRLAVFGQDSHTRKKEKEKEKRNILFYKQKLNKFLKFKKRAQK
jgi:hypothetical protein